MPYRTRGYPEFAAAVKAREAAGQFGFMAQLKSTVWERVKGWTYPFETKQVRKALGIESDNRPYVIFISGILNDLTREKKLNVYRKTAPVQYRVAPKAS